MLCWRRMDEPSPRPLAGALSALPHGPSFRFVDSVTALDPGRSGSGTYRVRGDEAFLAGHFPGSPIVPGVILLEAMAQLAGVVAQCDPAVPPLDNLRLAAVHAAKIHDTAVPGELIEMEVEITARLGSLIRAQGKAFAAGRQLATADIVLGGGRTGAA